MNTIDAKKQVREKEDIKKNNEEAPEYKNNPPVNFLRKQTYERQMHMEKVETKMSSAQQINCCMSLKHTTESDIDLRRHRRHLSWTGRGVRAQSHMGMARLLFYTTQVITGHGFRGSKRRAHTTGVTQSPLSLWERQPRCHVDPALPCTSPSLPIPQESVILGDQKI